MVRAMTTRAAQDPKTPKQAFQTENKSLESEAVENKAANEPVAVAEPSEGPAAVVTATNEDTVKVTMVHHGSHDGKDLLPGRDYDLPARKAQTLVSGKRAVLAESDSE